MSRSPGVVRRAVPSDLDAIARIESDSFATSGERFGRRQIAGLLRNPRAVTLVFESGPSGASAGVSGRSGADEDAGTGAVVGWCCGLVRRASSGRTAGRVYSIAVAPAGRGTGGGRAMLRALLDALSVRGADRVYLEVRADNDPAITLYRTEGFVEIERLPSYYGAGLHGVRMRREPTGP